MVARLRNFSRAAEELNVSQSALSRQVKLLEDNLGVELLVRTSRGVELTDAGRVVLDRAEEVLRQIQSLKRDVVALSQTPTGRFGVGFPASLGRLLVSPIIAKLSGQYPELEYSLFEGFSEEISSLVAQEKLDLGIISRAATTSGLHSAPILKERLWLIGPPDRWTYGKRPIVPAQLAGMPILCTSTVSSHLTTWLAEHAVTPGRISASHSMGTLLDLTRAGIGWIVAPRGACLQELADHQLQGQPIEGLYLTRFLISRRARRPRSIVKTFIEYLDQQIGSLAGEPGNNFEKVASNPRDDND
jgi:LysR family nitrogen assimilation transcriptional regulator